MTERACAHRAAQLARRDASRAGGRGGACVLEPRPALPGDGPPAGDLAALRRLEPVDAVRPGQPACSH